MSPTKHLPSFILLGSFSLRSQTTHFNQFCGSPEHPFLPPLFPSLERKEPFVFEICCLPSNWSQNLTPKLAQSCCTGPWHVLLCSTFVDSMVNWFHCHSAFTIWKSLLIFHRNLSSRNVSLFDSILPSRAAGNNFGSPKQRYQKHQLQQIVKPIAIFTIKKCSFCTGVQRWCLSACKLLAVLILPAAHVRLLGNYALYDANYPRRHGLLQLRVVITNLTERVREIPSGNLLICLCISSWSGLIKNICLLFHTVSHSSLDYGRPVKRRN